MVQEPARQVAAPEAVVVRGVGGREQVEDRERRMRGGERRQGQQRRGLGRLRGSRVRQAAGRQARAHARAGAGTASGVDCLSVAVVMTKMMKMMEIIIAHVAHLYIAAFLSLSHNCMTIYN